jgi:hypothetical protein
VSQPLSPRVDRPRPYPAHRRGAQLTEAAVAFAATLASFFAAWGIETAARQHTNLPVLAIALSLSMGRRIRAHGVRIRTLLTVPIVAAIAAATGELMAHHTVIGDAVFCVALSGGIYVRRFGPRWSQVGTLAAMPFIAMLVVPVPVLPGSSAGAATGWSVVVAASTIGCLTLIYALAGRLGLFAGRSPDVPRAPQRPHIPPSAVATGAAAGSARRLPASTRMAMQMGLSLASAFACGHQFFPHHWTWPVVTAYVVAAGNRGRGDVVHKSGLRLVGALSGTVLAAVTAGLFATGDRWAVVAILGVLAVGSYLRTISYAFWAGCVTASLSLLYGYFGERAGDVLDQRVAGIACGAIIAVLVAWFVFPVRTADVLRRRTANTLAALTDYLSAARRLDLADLQTQYRRFTVSLEQLEQLAPALRAHRRTVGRWQRTHPADVLTALGGCREPLFALIGALSSAASPATHQKALAELQSNVVAARRLLAGRR